MNFNDSGGNTNDMQFIAVPNVKWPALNIVHNNEQIT
jgi:hypothetical protein